MSITVAAPSTSGCSILAYWVTESDPSGTEVGFLGEFIIPNPALTTYILTINSLTSQATPWGATDDGSGCYENNFTGSFIPGLSFALALSHVSPPLTSPG